MSDQTTTQNTENTLWTDTDLSKIFLWNNRYDKATYTNSTGSEVTLAPGTVMGKVGATNKLLPLVAAATDGSQFPVGVLAKGATVANGASVDLEYCIGGDVAAEKLIFNAAEGLTTDVDDRTIGDRLKSDTLGINPVTGTELTKADNS